MVSRRHFIFERFDRVHLFLTRQALFVTTRPVRERFQLGGKSHFRKSKTVSLRKFYFVDKILNLLLALGWSSEIVYKEQEMRAIQKHVEDFALFLCQHERPEEY